MKRITFSIILGFLFPLICVLVIAISAEFFPDELSLTNFYGQEAPGVLFAPFMLPIYFDIYTKANHILPQVFDTVLFRTVSFILFDWVLYGLLSYWLLGKLKRFKKQNVEASAEPPPPPSFED